MKSLYIYIFFFTVNWSSGTSHDSQGKIWKPWYPAT